MAEETDSTGDAKTFTPDVVDYIRRCDTVSQALEIVDFLMKQNGTSSASYTKSQIIYFQKTFLNMLKQR